MLLPYGSSTIDYLAPSCSTIRALSRMQPTLLRKPTCLAQEKQHVSPFSQGHIKNAVVPHQARRYRSYRTPHFIPLPSPRCAVAARKPRIAVPMTTSVHPLRRELDHAVSSSHIAFCLLTCSAAEASEVVTAWDEELGAR